MVDINLGVVGHNYIGHNYIGGLAVVDINLGVALGHRPANAADDFGASIMAALKVLKTTAQRKDNETATQRRDRLRSSLLRVYTELPPQLAVVMWPTVVAFSLTLKAWGHLLVDGLQPAPWSGSAWRELVLPLPVKEMLRCTAVSALRSNQCANLDGVYNGDTDVAAAAELLSRPPRYTT